MGTLIRDCFLFAMTGLGLEVVFTGVLALFAGKANVVDHDIPMGYTSPLYIPAYTTIAFIFHFYGTELIQWHFLLRFLFYAVYAFVLEYAQNSILKAIFGRAPSEKIYRASGLSVNGMVVIYYPLIFGMAGFLFEWIYRSIL